KPARTLEFLITSSILRLLARLKPLQINFESLDSRKNFHFNGTRSTTERKFSVVPGGTHTGGLTANALVILADGVYLELISFTHPSSYYPPGSPERVARDANPWSSKSPGWIDFAFLGNGSLTDNRISDIINQRGRREGSGVIYNSEVAGGRKRPDGKVLKW
ncbi:hypothetical protein H0H93_002685, partial [Arthromyces matolae]